MFEPLADANDLEFSIDSLDRNGRDDGIDARRQRFCGLFSDRDERMSRRPQPNRAADGRRLSIGIRLLRTYERTHPQR